MPLFIYECPACGHCIEKFRHNAKEELELECEVCGEADYERQFSATKNRVWLDAKALYKDKIAPDAKRIMDKMKKGGDKEFFDVYGEK